MFDKQQLTNNGACNKNYSEQIAQEKTVKSATSKKTMKQRKPLPIAKFISISQCLCMIIDN
jgi:hypothetical protein